MLVQPVEDAIRHQPGKHSISDAHRKLFAIPIHKGGLGIPILPDVASI